MRLAFVTSVVIWAAAAQSNTVVTRRLTFPAGQSVVEQSGKADYAMSYVWRFRAQKGQKVEISLTSDGGRVKFSFSGDNTDTFRDGFLVDHWSGALPLTDDYNIVIVMNDEKAKNIAYRLRLRKADP